MNELVTKSKRIEVLYKLFPSYNVQLMRFAYKQKCFIRTHDHTLIIDDTLVFRV